MKKILASLMALAMFVSVAVVMVGCGNNVNGEYKFSHATFTVITKVDEDGKVTETKTYSEEEYTKICYVWSEIDHEKSAEDALKVELNEDQTKEYNEMLEEIRADIRCEAVYGELDADEVTISLKNGKANLVGTKVNDGVYTYEKEVLTIEGTYEVKEDKLYFRTLDVGSESCYEGLEDYKTAGYDIQILALNEEHTNATLSSWYSTNPDEDYTGKEFSAANAMVIYRTDLVFVEA